MRRLNETEDTEKCRRTNPASFIAQIKLEKREVTCPSLTIGRVMGLWVRLMGPTYELELWANWRWLLGWHSDAVELKWLDSIQWIHTVIHWGAEWSGESSVESSTESKVRQRKRKYHSRLSGAVGSRTKQGSQSSEIVGWIEEQRCS